MVSNVTYTGVCYNWTSLRFKLWNHATLYMRLPCLDTWSSKCASPQFFHVPPSMGRCCIDFKEPEGTKKNKRYEEDQKVNLFIWRVWLSAYCVTRLCVDGTYEKEKMRPLTQGFQSLQRRQAPMTTVCCWGTIVPQIWGFADEKPELGL